MYWHVYSLIEAGYWWAPYQRTKRLKEEKPDTGFISRQEEIAPCLLLLTATTKKIAILCLSTGARWGGSSSFESENIIHNRVTFVKTKTNKPRTVPISEAVAKMIGQQTRFLFPDADYPRFRRTIESNKTGFANGANHTCTKSTALPLISWLMEKYYHATTDTTFTRGLSKLWFTLILRQSTFRTPFLLIR